MATYQFNVFTNWGVPNGQSSTTNTFTTTLTTGTLADADSGNVFTVGETLTFGAQSLQFVGTITTTGGEVLLVTRNIATGQRIVFTQSASPSTVAWPSTINNNSITASDFSMCFAAGTLIATPVGARAVETLAIGDLVTTADGRAVPVKWMGHQTVMRLFAGERARPVRVAAGALGNGLPQADLVLTADHALILDGLAVNAGALVNGTTITLDPAPERATYWHVETEGHEVILANGAAAETFVDYLTRRTFDNHAEYAALYGDERTIAEMPLPRVSSRRQLPAALRARFGIADFADEVTAEARAFLAARVA